VDATGTAARFFGPQGLALDNSGNLYVADTNNATIRKVVISTGVVTTVAGLSRNIVTVDGPGSMARFYYPSAVTVDAAGNLYVTDTEDATIRAISPLGVVTTIAGQHGNFWSNADGVGNAARFSFPTGITVDNAGNLYIADTNHHTIRLGYFAAAPTITTQPQSQTVTAGNNVQFTVTASGKPAPSYQWNFNGAAISGATNNTLSLTNVQSADAGDYTVTAANASGSVTSNRATLTVSAIPSVASAAGTVSGGGGGTMAAWFVLALALVGISRWAARAAAP
jgi:sugar lactone lactonase YvrE